MAIAPTLLYDNARRLIVWPRSWAREEKILVHDADKMAFPLVMEIIMRAGVAFNRQPVVVDFALFLDEA